MRDTEQKNERARFKRRKSNLLTAGHNIHIFHQLDIYILIEAEGKYTQYTTYKKRSPPSRSKLNGDLKHLHRRYEFTRGSRQQNDINRTVEKVFKASRAIHTKCKARVYTLVSNGEGFLTYSYPEIDKHWPPPVTKLKKWFPTMEQKSPESYTSNGHCLFQFSKGQANRGQDEVLDTTTPLPKLNYPEVEEFQANDDCYSSLILLNSFQETTL